MVVVVVAGWGVSRHVRDKRPGEHLLIRCASPLAPPPHPTPTPAFATVAAHVGFVMSRSSRAELTGAFGASWLGTFQSLLNAANPKKKKVSGNKHGFFAQFLLCVVSSFVLCEANGFPLTTAGFTIPVFSRWLASYLQTL